MSLKRYNYGNKLFAENNILQFSRYIAILVWMQYRLTPPLPLPAKGEVSSVLQQSENRYIKKLHICLLQRGQILFGNVLKFCFSEVAYLNRFCSLR
jgi:hypothetical protein